MNLKQIFILSTNDLTTLFVQVRYLNLENIWLLGDKKRTMSLRTVTIALGSPAARRRLTAYHPPPPPTVITVIYCLVLPPCWSSSRFHYQTTYRFFGVVNYSEHSTITCGFFGTANVLWFEWSLWILNILNAFVELRSGSGL